MHIAMLGTEETEVRKVRSGGPAGLQCHTLNMQGTYSWRKNNQIITQQIIGIDSESIDDNSLRITRMSQVLVGIYECLLDDIPQKMFDVKIVGALFFCAFFN